MSDIKIIEYDEFANQLDHLAEVANFVPDVSDKDGYDKCKEIHRNFRKLENSIEKIRKDKKAYWIEGSKQVDSQAKAIMNKISELRLPHTEAYQTLDAEKKERERLRTEKLNERVEYIRTLPELLADSCSDEILPAMEAMQTEECLNFYEFTELALKARNATCKALADLYASKLKFEKESEELERLRAESAKRDQEDREERIRKEAAHKADQARLDAEERERQSLERSERLEREANQAEERRIEAEKQAVIDRENAAENARLAEVKRQNDIAEAERVATKKRESDKKHIGAIRKKIKELFMLIGIDEKQAKALVMAINNGKIENVSIKY